MPTTPHGIEYPDTGSPIDAIQVLFGTLANTTDSALDGLGLRGHYTGTDTEREALEAPDLRAGIFFYTSDTNLMWFYNGAAWKVIPSRPILAQVTKNVAQAMASAQYITWSSSSPTIDTDSFYSTSQNTRLTIPVSGLYRLTVTLNAPSTTSVLTSVNFHRNGNLYAIGNGSGRGGVGNGLNAHESIIANLTANDYMEIRTAVTGASGNWSNSGGECVFSAEFLGQL